MNVLYIHACIHAYTHTHTHTHTHTQVLIKQSGTYTFYTSSFDGSRVFVENELVVDNSGYHFQ
jgi:hypothetical protein